VSAHAEYNAQSRWWYWLVADVVIGVVGLLAGYAVAVLVLFAGAGFALGGPRAVFGLSVVTLLIVVLPLLALFFVWLIVGLVTPFALYFDAEAIATADADWEPDPTLYAGAGAVGLFANPTGVPLQPAVAAYYLYRRHKHVGTP